MVLELVAQGRAECAPRRQFCWAARTFLEMVLEFEAPLELRAKEIASLTWSMVTDVQLS